jgi:hypothetical protein
MVAGLPTRAGIDRNEDLETNGASPGQVAVMLARPLLANRMENPVQRSIRVFPPDSFFSSIGVKT